MALCLIFAGLSLFVVSGPAVAQPIPSGNLSFLHLSPDAPSLDVYIDGGRTILGLGFGETSEYIGLTPGTHKVQVTTSGRLDVVLSESIAIQAAASSTWVLSGLIAAADVTFPLTPELLLSHVLQLSDNAGLSSDSRPRLRIVNASPGSGSLDIRANARGGLTLASSLAYGGASPYTTLDQGTLTITVSLAGNQGALATIAAITLQSPNAYTLVLGGVVPASVAANPPNPVQQFTSVRLTDQNSVRSAPLTRGCNQVVINLPAGTPIASLLTRVADPGLVTSIWRFSNQLKVLRAGYFSDTTAPLDYTATSAPQEPAFICVSATTTWNPTL